MSAEPKKFIEWEHFQTVEARLLAENEDLKAQLAASTERVHRDTMEMRAIIATKDSQIEALQDDLRAFAGILAATGTDSAETAMEWVTRAKIRGEDSGSGHSVTDLLLGK